MQAVFVLPGATPCFFFKQDIEKRSEGRSGKAETDEKAELTFGK